ncbi:MAG: hypothetical protein IJA27_03295 [Lachnospiraceae bacterium]|nr:hypothetical protein [Lachnospiraceae bacterium]
MERKLKRLWNMFRKKEEGAIYYYSHEFEYGENPEKSIKFLAKDIDAFLNCLDFEEDEE